MAHPVNTGLPDTNWTVINQGYQRPEVLNWLCIICFRLSITNIICRISTVWNGYQYIYNGHVPQRSTFYFLRKPQFLVGYKLPGKRTGIESRLQEVTRVSHVQFSHKCRITDDENDEQITQKNVIRQRSWTITSPTFYPVRVL